MRYSHRFLTSNIAFLLSSGPADQVAKWAALPADQRQQLKQQYNGAGVSLVVSAFGETDHPTSLDPATVANNLAQFVLNNDLDGIDVDYEDFDAIGKSNGSAEQWVATFTQTLRQKLPQGQFILSHAPLAPWLAPNAQFKAGAYVTINKNVGSMIDWVNFGRPFFSCML